MGWEKKVRGAASGYYYESLRTPNKPYPVKIYFGRGAPGQTAAAMADERKRQRQRDRDALRAEQQIVVQASRLAAELREWADVLMAAWLVLTGHHRHRGVWRLSKMIKKPRVGTAAWDHSLCQDPAYVRQLLKNVTDRAANGDKGAADQVAKILAAFPDLKPTVQAIGDLTTIVENAWIKVMAGGNDLASEAVRTEIAVIKADLLRPDSGLLDRTLVGVFVSSYMAHQHASTMAAQPTPNPATAAARERMLEVAQRRLVFAVRNLERLSQKASKGLNMPQAVQLFNPPLPQQPRGRRRRRTIGVNRRP